MEARWEQTLARRNARVDLDRRAAIRRVMPASRANIDPEDSGSLAGSLSGRILKPGEAPGRQRVLLFSEAPPCAGT